MPEGSKIIQIKHLKHKITQQCTCKDDKKTPLKHHITVQIITDEAKLHHTAFLIDTSYELISYLAPVAIKQLYLKDDNVISTTLSQRRIFCQKINRLASMR